MTDQIGRMIVAAAERGDLKAFIESLTEPERDELMWHIGLANFDDPLEGVGFEEWNQAIMPAYFPSSYSESQTVFWEWVDTVKRSPQPVPPFLFIAPRGHAKSTSAEMAVVKWGCRRIRHFGLYISATQNSANDHLANIAEVFESDGIRAHYPDLGDVAINQFHHSKGWKANVLTTKAGFKIEAVGLDAHVRGRKDGAQRPDFAVFDDIDDSEDSPRVVNTKIARIARGIGPALTANAAVIVAQNMTHPNSIVQRIIDGRADLFGGAIRVGPYPAVENMVLDFVDGEWRIADGTPTWPEGMPIQAAETLIRLIGVEAFRTESQQDISEEPGALWTRDLIQSTRVNSHPELFRIVVSVDPNKTGRGDDAGVVVCGIGKAADGKIHGYVLADGSSRSEPEVWRETAAELMIQWRAGGIVVEPAGLGKHAELTIRGAKTLEGRPPFDVWEAPTTASKGDRARPIRLLYAAGLVHHVGVFPYLESQMTTWVPRANVVSPGAVDALVHGLSFLMLDRKSSEVSRSAWTGMDRVRKSGAWG